MGVNYSLSISRYKVWAATVFEYLFTNGIFDVMQDLDSWCGHYVDDIALYCVVDKIRQLSINSKKTAQQLTNDFRDKFLNFIY